jgi:hypothetical protein
MLWQRACLFCGLIIASAFGLAQMEPVLSTGRAPDPTAKTLSEIRAAEKRRIPLEVLLKTGSRYAAGGPIEVTIIITNLFDAPLLMNSRMLVNHPRLQGELSFRIVDYSGHKVEIQSLITPLTVRDEDFVMLERGQSMQRTVDLADLYGMTQKGVYTIQACYHNEIDYRSPSQSAWKGIVWSEPVEIELD